MNMDKSGQGDCHIHMIMDGIYFRDAIDAHRDAVQMDWVRKVLAEYQRRGVTYLRDGGDTHEVCLAASKIAEEYGIEYRMPVFAIHRAGRYGKIVGFPYQDLREFRQMVQDAKTRGADFIKIMVSGILDFHEVGKMSCPPLPPEEIRELVNIVHGEEMAVMLHINEKEPILAAIEAGAESLEHGFYMDGECLQALAEHPESMWIPSIAPVGNQIGSGRFPDEVLSAIVQRQQENIRSLVQMGGRVALGSDAGAYHVYHGQAIADERTYILEALEGVQSGAETDAMLQESQNWVRGHFRRR